MVEMGMMMGNMFNMMNAAPSWDTATSIQSSIEEEKGKEEELQLFADLFDAEVGIRGPILKFDH